MRFGKACKVLRLIRGMSQTRLGEIVGKHPMFISQMETEDWMPPADLETRIRVALGWTPEMDAALDVLAALPFSEGPEGEHGA
jgi:transcriptional regulator with XRE-family HTH domain